MTRNTIKYQRLIDKLQNEMGSTLLSYLSDPEVLEVSLNPDSKLWINHQSKGYIDTGESMDGINAQQLICSIANYAGLVINEENSLLETELPILGYRFTGLISPTVVSPCFTIRKPSAQVFGLSHYIEQRMLKSQQADVIKDAILANQSLLIVGGSATGKTTFANTLLNEMVLLGKPNQRFIIIEDTRELACTASNKLELKTSRHIDHERLLKVTLRLSPDKVIVGECRGKETLMLLKAWNTGTRGGLATIHANTARSALQRIKDMAQESGYIPSPYLICESINMVISLGFNEKRQRSVNEIVYVTGYKDSEYVLQSSH